MSTIVTRAGKGSPLTNTEVDSNFTNLNTDKYQAGGALGTPASGTLTNCTGLPVSSGVSGLGAGVATFLATPTAANLAAAVVGETGTGSLVFAVSPTFTGAPLAPTAAVDTNTTQLATTGFVVGQGYLKSATASSTYVPLAGGVSMTGNLYTRGGFGMKGNVAGNPVMYDVTDQAGATVLEIGRADNVAATTAFDIHTGATSTDFDTRLEFTGGSGVSGGGTLNIVTTNLRWNSNALISAGGSYANPSWITSLAETKVLPTQTSNSGKYLQTNGTNTSWVTLDLSLYAPLASPTFTGIPAAPTAAVGTNTTQLATTAYVNAEIANDAPTKTGTGASGTWGIAITGNAATVTNGVYTTGNQTIAGNKSFTGNSGFGGSGAPAASLDVQATGANTIGSFFTTGVSDLNFRAGFMNGLAGSTGTSQAKVGLFYLGTGECATIDFKRGAGAVDGSIAFRTAGTERATLDNSGNFTATGAVTAYSDERIKENIQLIPNALAKVESVRGVTYTRKDNGAAGMGVIAQEIRKIAPEAILIHEDGMMSVAYGNLVGLLIEAVKELSGQVKELKAKVGS